MKRRIRPYSWVMAIVSPYVIPSPVFIIRDTPERIDFHVKNGDYLAMLATALGFIEERLTACGGADAEARLARELRDDLRYVHSKYRIDRRAKAAPIRPKGNLLG